MLPVLLGIGWGALVATPLFRRSHRSTVIARLEPTEPARAVLRNPTPRPLVHVIRVVTPLANVLRGIGARRHRRRVDEQMTRELPVVIDLLAVAIGAGCTPYLAVDVAARWAPASIAEPLADVHRDAALGATFTDALERLADAHAPLRPLVDALLSSDRYGAPVADALARLAVDARATLRRSAETRARTVPVRMLFPLVFLVLPAFALLSVVPALLAGLTST